MTDIQKAEAKAIERQVDQRALTPMEMISSLVQQGANPETLERVTAWAERMQANEAAKAYAQALNNFKALCPTIIRGGKGHTNTYAKLVDIDEQIRPVMAQCQLSATFRIVDDNKEWIKVECRLTHAMNHSESTSFGGPPDNGPGRNALQARASTVSYLERYTLKALLGLVDRDMADDDGAGGANSPEPPKPKSKAVVTASDDDKRRFAAVCAAKSDNAKPGKALLLKWLGQCQEMIQNENIAECAEWLETFGEIVDDEVANMSDRSVSEPAPASKPTDPDTDVSRGGWRADLPPTQPCKCNVCGSKFTLKEAQDMGGVCPGKCLVVHGDSCTDWGPI